MLISPIMIDLDFKRVPPAWCY